jgi:hypothetical protein
MTPDQSIEARRLLGWSQLRLAAAAELALPALVAFEAADFIILLGSGAASLFLNVIGAHALSADPEIP